MMFATLFQRPQTASQGTTLFPPLHVVAASRAGMVTAWADFATGENGIIHICRGHTDGVVDDGKTWRPSVTCPFHRITTFPPPRNELMEGNAQAELLDQAASTMETNTLFPANDAASLLPLRQQIIANATVLFPLVAKSKHKSPFRRLRPSPKVPFEIAVLATSTACSAQLFAEGPTSTSTRYQAILTYGPVTKQRTAATSDMSASVVGAMESLLGVLCFELGKRRDGAVDAISEGRRVGSLGGCVDGGLVRKVGGKGKAEGLKG